MDKDTIDRFAKKTSGMYGKQIIAAVDNFLTYNNWPNNKILFPDVCVTKPLYRNPINGMWPEIAFSPFKLKGFMKDNGICTRLIPYKHFVISGGFKGFLKRQLAEIVKRTYPFSIFFAPGFELLGHVLKKEN